MDPIQKQKQILPEGNTDATYDQPKNIIINKMPKRVSSTKIVSPDLSTIDNKKRNDTTLSSMPSSSIFTRNHTFTTGFPTTEMLREINNAREHPLLFVDKLNDFKKKIQEKNGQFFLNFKDKFGKTKYFKIKNGFKAVDNCIEFLEKLSKENKTLNKLIMKEELKLPMPVGKTTKCVDKEYIRGILNFKTIDLDKKYSIIDFHYDLCIPDPNISVLMQIIDDTNDNYQRRKNIFNPNAKFIGISEGEFNSSLQCYYLLFADKA